MKAIKISFLTLLIFFLGLFQPILSIVQFSQQDLEKPLKYRFCYVFQGEATGVILLFFRYRFFFYSTASVIFNARRTEDGDIRFHLDDIDETGYLIRTWGFRGKTLITAAADHNLEKARQVLARGYDLFKEKTAYYSRFIKRQKEYLYRIISDDKAAGKKVMAFKRDRQGVHSDFQQNIQILPVEYDEKYGIYFKIFPMLMEMIKIYNHSFLPGSPGNYTDLLQLKPGQEWKSIPLDFSPYINNIGAQATDTVEKYIKFKQGSPFRLKYRLESLTGSVVRILGQAIPQVKIWDGYKLWKVVRSLEIRLSDNSLLSDRFQVDIRKGKNKGGTARCELILMQ